MIIEILTISISYLSISDGNESRSYVMNMASDLAMASFNSIKDHFLLFWV
jgi:hypothetical protein